MFLFLSTTSFLYSQTDTAKNSSTPKQSFLDRYWQFLKPDSVKNTTYLIGAYNFMYTNKGYISHGGRGTYLSGGFNVGRLFSKKIVLAITVEFKAWKGLWPVYFSPNYINDFNNNFQNNLVDQKDSARAEAVKQLLNGNSRFTARGTFYGTYAIALSPIPNKYGGFMLVLKEGGIGIPVHGTYGTIFNPKGADWTGIGIPGKICFELVCKPLTFFKNIPKDKRGGLLQLSIFYERLSWKDAEFDGLPFKSFMNSSFINKYAIQDNIGFTVKFGLY